jgi:hypothetical protein
MFGMRSASISVSNDAYEVSEADHMESSHKQLFVMSGRCKVTSLHFPAGILIIDF